MQANRLRSPAHAFSPLQLLVRRVIFPKPARQSQSRRAGRASEVRERRVHVPGAQAIGPRRTPRKYDSDTSLSAGKMRDSGRDQAKVWGLPRKPDPNLIQKVRRTRTEFEKCYCVAARNCIKRPLMRSRLNTSFAAPSSTAEPGIPHTTLDASSCASV